ncbi:hypothetical protein QO179_23505 [Bacillus stercoris]|nr:hypothetical protein [Bacillus stercoris]
MKIKKLERVDKMTQTTVLEKGMSCSYIEIEENARSRRFIVPNMDNLNGRIASLVQKYPKLSLVRSGNAIVSSELDDASKLTDSLEGIPSSVDNSYLIDFCGNHPNLPVGEARYSEALNSILSDLEPKQVEESAPHGQFSVYDMTAKQDEADTTSNNLTSMFQQQLAQQKLNQKSVEKKEQTLSEKVNWLFFLIKIRLFQNLNLL